MKDETKILIMDNLLKWTENPKGTKGIQPVVYKGKEYRFYVEQIGESPFGSLGVSFADIGAPRKDSDGNT